jgi:hypothetical protein
LGYILAKVWLKNPMTLDEVWHDPVLNLSSPRTNQPPLGGIKCIVQNIEKCKTYNLKDMKLGFEPKGTHHSRGTKFKNNSQIGKNNHKWKKVKKKNKPNK